MSASTRTCPWMLWLAVAACSVDNRALDVAGQRNSPSASGAAGETSSPGSGGESGGSAGLGPSPAGAAASGAPSRPDPSCELRDALPSPVDLMIQLDSSASMLDALPPGGVSASVATKWDAVRLALTNFVQAEEMAQTGVGLSYFPQLVEGVPFSCATNAECLSAGPCTSSLCVQSVTTAASAGQPALTFFRAAGNVTVNCSGDAECGAGESCRSMTGVCVVPATAAGTGSVPNLTPDANGAAVLPLCSAQPDCAGLAGTTCEELGMCTLSVVTSCTPSVGCPTTAGACAPFPYSCLGQTRCDASDYAIPAVPISAASVGAPTLVESLTARLPEGLTPTGPALSGALAYAQLWARQHPERRVAVLLATDGFPTECTPIATPEIAQLAAAAAGGEQPLQTFVIGVFSSVDLGQDGQANLDALAIAGSTGRAWLADTAGDVARSFENALRAVRASAASCGVALDPDLARAPDVLQLELVSGAGVASPLSRVGGPEGCADSAGWYFVRDGIGVPARIELCPSACAAPDGSTRARLRIGCEDSADGE